jgi:hypothetical protein
MKLRKLWKNKNGQGVVEFALVLPFLVLLLIGIIEIGYAFYSYMIVANANREAVRFAARGRYTPDVVAERVRVAGGSHEIDPGVFEPNLQTSGDSANVGIIITHIPIDEDGELNFGDISQHIEGVVGEEINGEDRVRPIEGGDTEITAQELDDYQNKYGPITGDLNQLRVDAGYDPQVNEIVIVETFMLHDRLFDLFRLGTNELIPNPIPLYFRSVMRVMRDSRAGQ